MDDVKITLIAAFCFSVAFILCVHCLTTCVNYAIVLSSAITLIFSTVLVFAFKTDDSGVRIAMGLTLVIILAILAVSVYKNSISIKIHGVFLNYASKIISGHLWLTSYILIYLVILILLIALVLF